MSSENSTASDPSGNEDIQNIIYEYLFAIESDELAIMTIFKKLT